MQHLMTLQNPKHITELLIFRTDFMNRYSYLIILLHFSTLNLITYCGSECVQCHGVFGAGTV